MTAIKRETRSVCPICRKQIPAWLIQRENQIFMEKDCEEHGHFSVPVWRNHVDMDAWRGSVPALPQDTVDCAHCNGLCEAHQQGSCCVLLEITRRCNLACSYCFADGDLPEPTLAEIKEAIDRIYNGKRWPTLQLSGGEPTLRDDLPEIIAYAKEKGAPYVQLNSNGLRLAQDEAFTESLAKAGLSYVFMQFDSVDDAVFVKLRNRPLLKEKEKAIAVCDQYRLGVTLVPTIVKGINDHQIGAIIRWAAGLSPAVRGVHFQPVSYFGRYPHIPSGEERYTLDELLRDIETQGHIHPQNIVQSHCDHPLCGCHGSFMVLPDQSLVPLSQKKERDCCCVTTAEQNRDFVGTRWQRDALAETSCCCEVPKEETSCSCGTMHEEESCCCGEIKEDFTDMETFLKRAKSHSFTITAMAFQDAYNLDIERLRRCSLHVYDNGVLKPFCARYLTVDKR